MGIDVLIRGAGTGELALSRIAWEGGPAYWEQFSKANAAGWSSDTFFPIAIFLGSVGDVQSYLDLGINTYMAVNYEPPLTDFTDLGMFVIPNYTVTAPDNSVDSGWSVAEVGSNPLAVGWFIFDEAEQGESIYWDLYNEPDEEAGSTEYQRLAFFQSETQDKRDLADGRFMFANFGNGVMGTWWAPNTMADFFQTVDAACVDKYAYTSPSTRSLFADAPNWPTGADPRTSAAYGWFAQQMRDEYDNPADRRPCWVFIETKMPLLNETDAEIILYDEIRGAVWSAIANEARGIAYFDYNGNYVGWTGNDPNTGSPPDQDSPALINCEAALGTYVATLNAQVTALASVLNTQSYVFNFSATGIKTMLKSYQGYAYIFASVDVDGTTGSKTFTLTGSGITGTTVEVIDESRSLNVSGGQFSDTFANEYSHHIYKVAI